MSQSFLDLDNERCDLQRPPQLPEPRPVEQLWDVVEEEILITAVQQLSDVLVSVWTQIFEECFQPLVESMPGSSGGKRGSNRDVLRALRKAREAAHWDQ